MPKRAAYSVTWNAQQARYQVNEPSGQDVACLGLNVESDHWLAWLERVNSFAFQSKDGHRFTAYKERRARGRTYWRAQRRVRGKLVKQYLGPPTVLTLGRLEQMASHLTLTQTAASPTTRRPDQSEPAVHQQVQEHLLTTKFFVPVSWRILIRRPRLLALLDQGLRCPLTLLSAPAGFGKTTLLSAWVQSLAPDDPLVVWVSLDAWDNTPARFWAAVLTALDKGTAGLSQDALALLQARQEPPLEAVLTALINALSEAVTRRVLILDDYQVITEPAIHRQLAFLLEHLPAHLHVMLSTRVDPPVPLARLRARGQLLEVRTDQLRCTAEEAAAFLTTAMGLELADSLLHKATARTEGWLVGLQLLGLSLHGHADPTTVLEELSGSQRYILDYLTEEVLRQQPAALQRFLLHTSILSQLCASLCDAVTGQTGSQEVLEGLERANLFLTLLDAKRHWYRYHALFAEALSHSLAQVEPEAVPVLHLRASQWYAERGTLNEAIRHALQAQAWQQAADLLESLPSTDFWEDIASPTTVHWLRQLPVKILQARPRLCLLYARILFLTGHLQAVDPWLQAAEAALVAAAQASRTQEAAALPELSGHERESRLGQIAARRALVAGYYGHGRAALQQAQQALSHLSEQDRFERAMVAYAQALAALTEGQVVTGTHRLLKASRLMQAAGNRGAAITLLSTASSCLQVQGQLHQAWQTCQQAIELGLERGEPRSAAVGLAYLVQADVLREWNQLAAALSRATQGLHLARQTGYNALFLDQGLLVLIRVHLARGDLEEAEAILQQVTHSPVLVDNPYHQAWLITVDQVRCWLARGELWQAISWAGDLEHARRSAAPLAREREAVALVRVRLAQGRADEALQLLNAWLVRAQATARWNHLLEMKLLEALAYQMSQREKEALRTLAQVVALAEPEGYIRCFVDEGQEMAALLSHLQRQQREKGPTPYLDTVLAAFAQQSRPEEPLSSPPAGKDHPARTTSHVPPPPLLDPLSARELEVLHLVARGASNQDIAEALVVTVETVKRHVSNLFSKLGVHKRTQAMAQARALGLLSDEP